MQQITLAVLILTLSACGGSGGSEIPSRADRAALLADDVLSDGISDPGRLPDSGSARYDGFMTLRLPTQADGSRRRYTGDLTLNVDFAAPRDQITGRAGGFATRGGDALDGGLRLRGGDLYRDTDPDENYTFTGNLDGTLRRGRADYAIDARIEGEFRGRGQTGVNGLVFGDVTGPQGQDIFDGDFVAARD